MQLSAWTWCLAYASFIVSATANVISMPIARSHGSPSSNSENRVAKRDFSSFVQTNAVRSAETSYYYTNVTIGHPPQPIALVIDSGSSDIWVPSKKLTLRPGVTEANFGLGFFDETRSSTYKTLPSIFEAGFGNGLLVEGTYMTDTLTIGGTGGEGRWVEVGRLVMAIATNGSLAENFNKNRTTVEHATGFNGLMGLGPDLTQSNISNCVFEPAPKGCQGLRECEERQVAPCVHPGLLDLLVREKAIGLRAYSLYLDGLEERTGNILFGGIDTAKFEPPLIRVPLDPDRPQFVLNLTSVSASPAMDSGSDTVQFGALNNSVNFRLPNDSSVPIWLDSGSAFIDLPKPLAESLQAYAGAYLQPGISGPLIPCEQSKNKSTIKFGLGGHGGPVISVPIGELITPLLFVNGSKIVKEGREICQFGIWSFYGDDLQLTQNTFVFGDAFLRSAYAVYNIDDWSISLAQTRFGSTDSNIQEIDVNQTLNKRALR